MVHLQHVCSSSARQGPSRCGPRICLLKGCERWFSPHHPRARYCSKACADAARLWSRRTAAQRYRASERGKEQRRQQACRYRQRVRERSREGPPSTGTDVGEGHHKAEDAEKICCSRPGCYESFPPDRRWPLKKFCCALCREALRRVRQREARWGWRESSVSDEDRYGRFYGPPEGFS